MGARISIGLSAALALACTGCVYGPPPPYAAMPPAAQAQAQPPQQVCHEFRQTITIGNETKDGWGTTCQQPDGRWVTVTPPDAMADQQPAPQVAVAPSAPAYPYAYPPYYPSYPYYYPPPVVGGVFIRGGGRWR
jgi:hypothetical protein